jgi:hypothetical protein
LRTTLKQVKNRLSSDILNANYKSFFYKEMNFKSFLIAFFPSNFINSEENRSIINTNTNKSSRLSNIFNRALAPKKMEFKFRERFINDFNLESYQELLENVRFFLRGYNADAFHLYIEEVLKEDEELNQTEYKIIHQLLHDHYKILPEVTLAVLILWAFHIGSFDTIIKVISSNESTDASYHDMKEISDLIHKRNLTPKHVYEYLNIATSYGISGGLAAISLKSHIEKTNDVNPLIYNEVANMYYYGYHLPAKDRIKAQKLYKSSSEQGFGAALWTVALLGGNSRYQAEKDQISKTIAYFNQSIEYGNLISYNNLGIYYHRALIYYLTEVFYFKYALDCFGIELKHNIISTYNEISQEKNFKHMIHQYQLDKPVDSNGFDKCYDALGHLHQAENHIIDLYFKPSFEFGHFYAKGSELMIYEKQMERYHKLYSDFSKEFTDSEICHNLRKKILDATEKFACYPCSESYYKYGKMLEAKGHSHHQSAYEHYYDAVFEVPLSNCRYNAMIKLLILHKSPYVHYKNNSISNFDLLQNIFNHYISDIHDHTELLLDLLKLYSKEIKQLSFDTQSIDKLISNLILEKNSHPLKSDVYDDYIQRLEKL